MYSNLDMFIWATYCCENWLFLSLVFGWFTQGQSQSLQCFCVCQLVCLMKRSIGMDPFSAPWNIHSVDIQLVPPQEGKLDSKERRKCFFFFFLVASFLLSVMPTCFEHLYFQTTHGVKWQNNVYKKRWINLLSFSFFFSFFSEGNCCLSHWITRQKYEGNLFVHTVLMALNPLSLYSQNPVLIYVVLYRTNSGIKYSIYDCIIV